jgi:hypothetical protein
VRPETYESILDRIRATEDTPQENIAECGHCHFRWDDTISTELTPAPSPRCPNEYNHVYPSETYTWSDPSAVWQAKHGLQDDPRTVSAWEYIEARLEGYTPEEINSSEE